MSFCLICHSLDSNGEKKSSGFFLPYHKQIGYLDHPAAFLWDWMYQADPHHLILEV